MEEEKIEQKIIKQKSGSIFFQSFDKSYQIEVDRRSLELGSYFSTIENSKYLKDEGVYVFSKGTKKETMDLIAKYLNVVHPVVLKRVEDQMAESAHFFEIYHEVGILDIPELIEKLDATAKSKIKNASEDLLQLLEYEQDISRMSLDDFYQHFAAVLPRYKKLDAYCDAICTIFTLLVERDRCDRMVHAALAGATEELSELLKHCDNPKYASDFFKKNNNNNKNIVRNMFLQTFNPKSKNYEKIDADFCLLLCRNEVYKTAANKRFNMVHDITHLVPEKKKYRDLFLNYYRTDGTEKQQAVIKQMIEHENAFEIYQWAFGIGETPIVTAITKSDWCFLLCRNKSYKVPVNKRYKFIHNINDLVPPFDAVNGDLFLNYYLTEGTEEQQEWINKMIEHDDVLDIYRWAEKIKEIKITEAIESCPPQLDRATFNRALKYSDALKKLAVLSVEHHLIRKKKYLEALKIIGGNIKCTDVIATMNEAIADLMMDKKHVCELLLCISESAPSFSIAKRTLKLTVGNVSCFSLEEGKFKWLVNYERFLFELAIFLGGKACYKIKSSWNDKVLDECFTWPTEEHLPDTSGNIEPTIIDCENVNSIEKILKEKYNVDSILQWWDHLEDWLNIEAKEKDFNPDYDYWNSMGKGSDRYCTIS